MIYIYYAYISKENHENLLENKLVEFPLEFQEKIKRYRKWQDAQLSLMGRILLFKGIKEIFKQDYQNKEIRLTKYNKPYFDDDLIHFNISHSGDIVICAITDKSEIGIDIEVISNIEIDDFAFQFTENEWSKINLANNKKEIFFECWTKKEAVIKAHGHGLTIPLKSFEILENETTVDQEKFFLQEIMIDDQYKCYLSQNKCFGEISIKQIQIN